METNIVGLRVVSIDSAVKPGGLVGTVSLPNIFANEELPQDMFFINWDDGSVENYDKKNLFRVIDNSQQGTHHPNVICDECSQDPVCGFRWKCQHCQSFDLCTSCFMRDKHDMNHTFHRVDTPVSIRISVKKRANCKKVEVKGIYEGATVTRGHDWKWANQDGGKGKKGTIRKTKGSKKMVEVKWDNGRTNFYRVGYEGKVDLCCVEPATGGNYYLELLPFLDEYGNLATAFKQNDIVKIRPDCLEPVIEMFKKNLTDLSGLKYMKKSGKVESFSDGKLRVCFGQRYSVPLLEKDLEKKESFSKGCKVRVIADKDMVERNQENHGGWVDKMKTVVGQLGEVVEVHPTGDLKIKFRTGVWTLNPESLEPTAEDSDKESTDEDGRNDSMDSSDDSDWEKKFLENMKKMKIPDLFGGGSDSGKDENGESDDDDEDDDDVGHDAIKEMMKYIIKEDTDRVQACLQKNQSKINSLMNGKTLLNAAASTKNYEIVKLLLTSGANVNKKDRTGMTALHIAGKNNDVKIIELLLKNKADVNLVDKNRATPLHLACHANNKEAVKLLLQDETCDINIKDCAKDTPFFEALENADEEIVEILLNDKRINLDVRNRKNFTVLHHAVFHNKICYAVQIVSLKKDLINAECDDDYTPLHIAAVNGFKEITEFLINQEDVKLNATSSKKSTPLMLAVEEKNPACIELLVKKSGVDVNAVDENGNNCLHILFKKNMKLSSMFKGSEFSEAPQMSKIKSELDENTDDKIVIACYLAMNAVSLEHKNKSGKTPLDTAPRSAVPLLLKYAKTEPFLSNQICAMCQEPSQKIVKFQPCGHAQICEDCSRRMKVCFICQITISEKL